MQIAIIGSGNVGQALARAAVRAGHRVDGIQLDGFYASDHENAKPAVVELVARTLEAMALMNMSLQMRNGWSWQTGWKLLGPTGA
jgi:predicted dinucleotide-binding enzyme